MPKRSSQPPQRAPYGFGPYAKRPYERDIIDGEYVKRLRAKLGLTQQSLASQIGISVSSVSRWERGQGRPIPIYRRAIRDLCLHYRISWESV